MMDTQLSLVSLIERAEKFFPNKEIISRTHTGIFRYNYREMAKRTRALSSVLTKLGVKKGDRVGTFAWNHHRHLEAYFGIPAIGAVLHTINIRLSTEHISYIINHAEDKVLLIDIDLLPIIEKIKDDLKTVKAFIVMSDDYDIASSSLEPLYSYESLINEGDENFQFSQNIEENDPAGLCYTSATTGLPKGVLYSHRGIVLHCLTAWHADTLALSEKDRMLPVVPMFHVNAWGIPFAATWFGSTQVYPGPNMTPTIIADLIEKEKVTITAGVPTIWLGLLKVLEEGKHTLESLRALISGGAPAPMEMIRKFEMTYGIPFLHAYGMTETSPLVTVSRLKSYQEDLSAEEKLKYKATQGLLVPCLKVKAVDDEGKEIPFDGKSYGEMLLQGPWIADSYYKDDRTKDAFVDGWLKTGDVVTIDEEGFIKIVDRTGDLIKSGGEWISSVDLENGLMAHESVSEAAVVAVPHEKWQERPVAFVALRPEARVSKEDLLYFLEKHLKFARWWLPDEIFFIEEIPKTSVGKFLKRELREKAKYMMTTQQ